MNTCTLVWEGVVLRPTFYNFRTEELKTSNMARKFLRYVSMHHTVRPCVPTPAALPCTGTDMTALYHAELWHVRSGSGHPGTLVGSVRTGTGRRTDGRVAVLQQHARRGAVLGHGDLDQPDSRS
jgi:hypothetical protein